MKFHEVHARTEMVFQDSGTALDSTCFEVQGVSGSKPSDLPGQGKALTESRPPRGVPAQAFAKP